MKKQTKQQKINDYFTAFKAVQKSKIPKRIGAKDGSISTYPIIPVHDYLESMVLNDCLLWLRKHGILHNRNNVGSGQIGESGYYNYGIKNAGDIIGLLKNGRHLEIECKRGKGGRLSAGQQNRQRNIIENNGLYFVVHGVEELEYFMKNLI